MPEKYLTVAEVMGWLRIQRVTLYYFIRAEKFPSHKIGKQYRFLENEIQEWISTNDIDAAGKRAAKKGD